MEVVIKVTNRYCDESQRRQEIVMCLDAFLCQQFLTIREWCKDIDVWVTGIVRIDKTLLALRCIEMWQSSICSSKLARRLSQYWCIFRNIQGQKVKK